MAGSVPLVSPELRVVLAVTGGAEEVVVGVDCSITAPAPLDAADEPVLPPGGGLPG